MRTGSPGLVPIAPPGSLALLVASGPAAGASVALPSGQTVVGRDAPLPLDDEEISRHHIMVAVDRDGAVTVADPGSTNGTVVSGLRLDGERPLPLGELIWAGSTALTIARAPAADAALVPADDGSFRYSRSPRLAEAPRHARRAMPDPPPEPERPSFPMVAVITPALAGLLMAVLLKQLVYLAFIALSPIMVIGNTFSDRRRSKRGYRQRVTDYERQRAAVVSEAEASRRAELDYRRHVHPDPATLLLIASAPSRRLWERTRSDDDFLGLRIGTGMVPWPSDTTQRGSDREAAVDELPDAPLVLPLADCGAIGVTGSAHQVRALARGMLLSLAVLHSPYEVSVTILTAQDIGSWDWIAGLPHARQPGAREGTARVGHDPDSIRLRLAELHSTLEARRPGTSHGRPRPGSSRCDVVVLDGSHQLRMDPAIAALLRDGPASGIYFLCLDDDVARLPPECRRAVVQLSDDRGATVATVHGPGYEITGIVADTVTARVCQAAVRAMAAIREESPRDEDDALPSAVRFLDLADRKSVV